MSPTRPPPPPGTWWTSAAPRAGSSNGSPDGSSRPWWRSSAATVRCRRCCAGPRRRYTRTSDGARSWWPRPSVAGPDRAASRAPDRRWWRCTPASCRRTSPRSAPTSATATALGRWRRGSSGSATGGCAPPSSSRETGRVTPGDREQPWRDDETERGRVVLLTDNPISRALATIAGTVGHEVVVIAEDDGGPGLGGLGLRAGDAVVLCDHDAPDASAVLREALASDASYVAMMASRRRAEGLRADLGAEGVPGLDKLHVPAGPQNRRQRAGGGGP